MIETGGYNCAINRAYYSCFYVLNAYFLKKGISTKTHDGIKQMLHLYLVRNGLVTVEEGRTYTRLLSDRVNCDYDDYFDSGAEEAERYRQFAEAFIAKIEKLIKD